LFRRRNKEDAVADLAITYRPVSELKPSDRNARTHSRKQIKQIAASIKRFGFTNPILIDDDDRIIAGHGRVAAAKLLRLTEVPTIRLSHLSAAEKRAYILADNRLAEKAGWDPEILAIELQELIDLDFQVELTGFEMPDVDIIVEGAGKVKAAGPEDEIPEPSSGATVSQPGDMWVLGGHRLLCADARENAAYVRLLNGEQAQFVFTHPPPNFAMAGEMSPEMFTRFLANVFGHLVTHTTDGSIHQICTSWRHIMEIVQAGNETYSELKDLCVWNKKHAQVGSFYRSQHELVFVWKSGSAKPIHNLKAGRLGRTNVWDYALPGRGVELALHPTLKPVDLVAEAIKDCSQKGGFVLDPFCGSGSVLIAAERTERKARALEIDPTVVDVAVRRWQTYSGKPAVLAANGETFAALAKRRAPEPAMV
jgi:DNA modification methylase